MTHNRKLASLRLNEEIIARIDRAISLLYAGLPAPPSRNAVMEAWILRGLEEAELHVAEHPEQASSG